MQSNRERTSSVPVKRSTGLPRKLLYIFGVLAFIGVSASAILFGHYAPRPAEILGFVIAMSMVFVPPYLYKSLRYGTGALRGLEAGSKSQFAEYLKRQPKAAQTLFHWSHRLRAAALGATAGGLLVFIGGAGAFSTAMTGWLVFIVGWSSWWVLNGAGTLLIRAGNFPKELWVSKREFVVGGKAVFTTCGRSICRVRFYHTSGRAARRTEPRNAQRSVRRR